MGKWGIMAGRAEKNLNPGLGDRITGFSLEP